MNTITIDLSTETYERLKEQARKTGQAPEAFSRHLIELALQPQEPPSPQTVREALHASGRARPLSETLRRKIVPGITLDEVRTILTQASGPSLTEIIEEHRGRRP